MPSLRKTAALLGLAALAALALAGCGDNNAQSTISGDSGKHVAANWIPGGHSVKALSDLNSCTECHGGDLNGGISKVSCTQCHLGDTTHIHPLAWGDLSYLRHADYVTRNGSRGCANAACHGTELSGVASSGPSCTSCHLGGPVQVHPFPITQWSNPTSPNFHGKYLGTHSSASCATLVCHGTLLQGVPGSGLSCQQCHALNLQQ